MTPEERTQAALIDFRASPTRRLLERVAQAITEAVAEAEEMALGQVAQMVKIAMKAEREACEKVARNFYKTAPDGVRLNSRPVGKAIATAIRARNLETSPDKAG